MDVLSSIRGLSYSLPDLYQQVSSNGWEIKKVKYDSSRDKFLATAKAPHDEEIEAWGPSEKVAVSNLLMNIVHRNGMRSSKLSMWTYTFTDQLPAIAEAYSKAPIYEPKAAVAFTMLGRDAEARAKALMDHLEITVVNDPEPYSDSEKMCEDIRKRRKLEVSRAGIEHPIWSDQQVIAFRIAFDVLGYCASGGDWGWEGTNRAFAAYAAMIPTEAQNALFAQVIGQTAYATYYHAYGPQKVALFPEFMDPAQSKENPHGGYRGIHPSQAHPPGEQPHIKPLVARLALAGLDPIYELEIPQAGSQEHTGAVNGLADPNEGWTSGAAPLPQNAMLDHDDPLDFTRPGGPQDVAKLIDTEWAHLNQENPADVQRMEQAIINAFRAVILSPRKNLKWNTQHVWDIRHIPAKENDPTVYQNALENARQDWNVDRFGEQARYSHRPWHALQKELEWVMYDKNPQAGFQGAQKRAEHFIFEQLARFKEEIAAQDEQLPEKKQKNANQIELAAHKEMAQWLKTYLKGEQMGMDFEAATTVEENPQQEFEFDVPQIPEQPTPERYGAWMEGQVAAIAQIGEHVDELLKAALYDVHEQDGTGHHFRSAVMQLGIKGVGPKVASFAWLLLQPMTSELATIDTHMLRVLGYKGGNETIPTRDYFKAERQLTAGRDAAGYGQMPLGQFQWAMWDAQRTGVGTHQNHSGLKVLNPTNPSSINWEDELPIMDDGGLANVDWWKATEPTREAIGNDFDQTVAAGVPQNRIPWNQGVPRALLPKAAASKLTPWLTHPQTGERVVGQPGQTIAQHAQSLGIGIPQLWQLTDVGKN